MDYNRRLEIALDFARSGKRKGLSPDYLERLSDWVGEGKELTERQIKALENIIAKFRIPMDESTVETKDGDDDSSETEPKRQKVELDTTTQPTRHYNYRPRTTASRQTRVEEDDEDDEKSPQKPRTYVNDPHRPRMMGRPMRLSIMPFVGQPVVAQPDEPVDFTDGDEALAALMAAETAAKSKDREDEIKMPVKKEGSIETVKKEKEKEKHIGTKRKEVPVVNKDTPKHSFNFVKSKPSPLSTSAAAVNVVNKSTEVDDDALLGLNF